jgi:hypothetical protein
MLKLEDVKKHAAVSGIDFGAPVRIVSTETIGDDALTVYYKTVDGTVLERMLFRADEAGLSLAQTGKPWAFDASGEEFKLAAEAFRIHLAYLFDPMMAVHTSNVDPTRIAGFRIEHKRPIKIVFPHLYLFRAGIVVRSKRIFDCQSLSLQYRIILHRRPLIGPCELSTF